MTRSKTRKAKALEHTAFTMIFVRFYIFCSNFEFSLCICLSRLPEVMEVVSAHRSQMMEEEKYAVRLREHVPDKFREMCYMHLSFILNLSDDKLERLLNNNEKSSSAKRKLGLVNPMPIFKKKGRPLPWFHLHVMVVSE